MSTLVTGGAGFIGSHLIERLLSDTDRQVVCVDNFNDYYDPKLKRANVASFVDDRRVSVVERDFRDATAMEEVFEQFCIGEVIHLGGFAGVRYSLRHPTVYHETNVRGTLTLLELARKYPVERFLLASSATVYGHGAVAPFAEDSSLGLPLSPYGTSKRSAELLCETYHRVYGVPAVSLRLFSVYGPRLRPDLAMSIFADKIFNGMPLPVYGDGTIRRDFTHVDDVCTGILKALSTARIVGKAVNIGHDEPVEMSQLVQLLEDAAGIRARVDYQPEHQGDMPVTHADLSRARELLGFEPTIDIEVGVNQFVRWFRENRSTNNGRIETGSGYRF